MKRAAALLGLLALGGCALAPRAAGPPSRMQAILESDPRLEPFLAAAPRYRLQAVLGTVVPGADGRPRLQQEGFRLDAEYFYPASTVKLLGAAAALERLAALGEESGLALTVDTPLALHPLFEGEALEREDPSNLEGGAITLRHEIRKLFLVSDNQAFNRLYAFLGQEVLADSLRRAGLPRAHVVHRLSQHRSAEENRRSPRVDFLTAGGGLLFSLPERRNEPLPEPAPVAGLRVGRAHLDSADPPRRLEEPFDFSPKNRVPLADLQRALCMLVSPEVDCGGPGFALDGDHRALLLEAMRGHAGDSRNPVYDRAEHPDEAVKPFLRGLQRVLPKERLEVYNKVGWAYGFSTDNAWIVDRETGRSFFLAATIYANADEVLNDDSYEYDTVAWPFLADLAEVAARFLWR